MNKNLVKELDDLKGAGVIDEETAGRISEYYKSKGEGAQNRLFVVFGVLGAILVGLGIILIIAHNWDDLSRPVKVILSFLPLMAGQGACAFSLLRKRDSPAWKESSAAFLFFAVGASISLISQVYHIHGDLGSFLFTWMILCFPLIYLLDSSVSSLLFIAGITYYNLATNVFSDFFHKDETLHYWWMLFLVVPHYIKLYRKEPDSNYLIMHNWIMPLSLTCSLGALAHRSEELIFVAYMSLFSIFYMIGSSPFFNHTKRRVNGYLVLGSLGIMHILMINSFHWFWEHLSASYLSTKGWLQSREFLAALVLTLISLLLFLLDIRKKRAEGFRPMKGVFLVYLIIYLIGFRSSTLPVILINGLVLVLGVFTIRLGAKQDHLGVLNYGLLTITVLIICRFFDSDMSFVLRGILFVLVGAGFFAANYFLLRKRKQNGI